MWILVQIPSAYGVSPFPEKPVNWLVFFFDYLSYSCVVIVGHLFKCVHYFNVIVLWVGHFWKIFQYIEIYWVKYIECLYSTLITCFVIGWYIVLCNFYILCWYFFTHFECISCKIEIFYTLMQRLLSFGQFWNIHNLYICI